METALLYLLKAHVVLALFVAAYYGLLRRLTFFKLNRAYLLFALLFAAVYPALPMPGLLPAEAPAAPVVAWVLTEAPGATTVVAPAPAAPGPDWPLLALTLYAGGVAALLARLLVQLLALARLRRAARPAITAAGVAYRELPAPGDPFSFGRTIYLHPAQHTAAELAVVLAHEQAHVRQGHTLDVLLAHLGTALFWLNPAAWLLRRALLDNLEYLADAATLRTGLDRRAYQYCLLQLSRGTAGPALALPFTFFTLKNRVAMMNTPLSSRGQLARYFLAGPLVMLAALGYSAAHARSAEPTELGAASLASLAAPAPSTPETPAAPAATAPAAATEKLVEKPKKPTFELPQAASAYLASTYPQAKITEVMKGSFTLNGPTVYVVGLKQRQREFGLSFDAAGQFLGEIKGKFFLYGPIGLFSPRTPISPTKQASARPATSQPASASSTQTGPAPLYYLDGQAITEAQFRALKPTEIASIQVLKGEAARQMAGDKGRDGILVITTEANKSSAAVLEFNQRVQRFAPLQAEPSKPPVAFALPADALYYLDGKPSTKQVVEQLDQKSIANVDVVKESARIHRIPGLADSPATSVILMTTKANADAPDVRAFADQADLASAYTSRTVATYYLGASTLAYITSHYPNARLGEVNELKQKTTGTVKYQVQLINGKRPFFIYFSQKQEPLGE
jgi:hypothetical protein